MGEPVLLLEKKDGIATVTLNRPKAMNALSAELREALATTFQELAGDREVGVVILTGAGRAFCAGLDLKEMEVAGPGGGAYGSGEDAIRAIERIPQPVIGAINGVAITGGFELALACDILVGSQEARFADTHARVGILPGWGLSQKLPRLIGVVRAKSLSLTGNFLAAEQAERWGLLCRVVEADALLESCREMAGDILSCEAEAVRGYKRLIDEGFGMAYADARRYEGAVSRAQVASVSAGDVAARRQAIQSRGRKQTR